MKLPVLGVGGAFQAVSFSLFIKGDVFLLTISLKCILEGRNFDVWPLRSPPNLHTVYFKQNKRSSALPFADQWEAFMLPNYSCFGATEEEHTL